jgi:hypothetical protein
MGAEGGRRGTGPSRWTRQAGPCTLKNPGRRKVGSDRTQGNQPQSHQLISPSQFTRRHYPYLPFLSVNHQSLLPIIFNLSLCTCLCSFSCSHGLSPTLACVYGQTPYPQKNQYLERCTASKCDNLVPNISLIDIIMSYEANLSFQFGIQATHDSTSHRHRHSRRRLYSVETSSNPSYIHVHNTRSLTKQSRAI